MTKNIERIINNTKKFPLKIRAQIIYAHLVIGLSTRKIEKDLLDVQDDGWTSWEVLQAYGLNKSTKGTKPNYSLDDIEEKISSINLNDVKDFLENQNDNDIDIPIAAYTEKDGTDVFYRTNVRVGQAKWRRNLIRNYKSKCALCEVSEPILLIASHIKPWAESSQEEKVSNENGIILCALHDRLFDKGLISLSDNYDVLYSDNIDFVKQGLRTNLKFRAPLSEPPNPDLLKHHREKTFKI